MYLSIKSKSTDISELYMNNLCNSLLHSPVHHTFIRREFSNITGTQQELNEARELNADIM